MPPIKDDCSIDKERCAAIDDCSNDKERCAAVTCSHVVTFQAAHLPPGIGPDSLATIQVPSTQVLLNSGIIADYMQDSCTPFQQEVP